MEISTKAYQPVELITVKGRVDSVEAPRLAEALEAAQHRGKYRIVVDMSQVEYMSSASFRALGDAQRNCKRHPGGEVILAHVPESVRTALELVGFTEYFHIFDSVASALEYVTNLSGDQASAEIESISPET